MSNRLEFSNDLANLDFTRRSDNANSRDAKNLFDDMPWKIQSALRITSPEGSKLQVTGTKDDGYSAEYRQGASSGLVENVPIPTCRKLLDLFASGDPGWKDQVTWNGPSPRLATPAKSGCFALLLAGLFVLAAVGSKAFAVQPPNIILAMADDQGWGDMGYNGHPHIQTPHFDDMAKTGLRFDRFYAAHPVCSPTRASVMTGRTPNRSAVFQWGWPLRPQEHTIAEQLKAAGYATGHFGKWHLGSVLADTPANPGGHGFDEWKSAYNFYENDGTLSHQGKAVAYKKEGSMMAVDDALAFIEPHAKADTPFLAVVWFGNPHLPHIARPRDLELYKDQPKNLANFYGEITGMDRAFGKLRDALGPLGIRSNTVLWYCSDNGALKKVGNTGGRRGNKGQTWDGGLAVPALLEWPARIKKPAGTELRCSTCDIYPTVLEMAGVNPPLRVLDGVSLMPVLDGTMTARPPLGFWNYPIGGKGTPSERWMKELLADQKAGRPHRPPERLQADAAVIKNQFPLDAFPGHAAWIDGDWKLHRIESKGKTTFHLYDLKADFAETKDLIDAKSERATKMQKALEQWLSSVARSQNGEDYK